MLSTAASSTLRYLEALELNLGNYLGPIIIKAALKSVVRLLRKKGWSEEIRGATAELWGVPTSRKKQRRKLTLILGTIRAGAQN